MFVPETFPREATNPIATDGPGDFFLGHGKTQPRLVELIIPVKHGEIAIPGSARTTEHPLELGGCRKSGKTAETESLTGRRCIPLWDRLVAQARALFLAPAFKHGTTALGCHSGSETVGPFALDTAWLIRTFHYSAELAVVAGRWLSP